MLTRVLTLANAAEWDGYLSRLPGADVYHTAAYHAAHQANGDGTAMAFVAEEGDNLLFHPFILRDIPGTQWRDLETVYGYSGPICSGRDFLFFVDAWCRFGDFCRDRNVVASFVRFNPLTGNGPTDMAHAVAPDRETVVIDLSGDLMAGYSPTARNKIRKAEKARLWAGQAIGPELDSFKRLYAETMARNEAADYYSFGDRYFYALLQGPVLAGQRDRLTLFAVKDQGRVVCASLFLLHNDRMHYHLTGSDAAYRDSGAGNLLIHTAALWGQQHGYRWLHLGGGRTNAPDDALLRFKASMSRERRPWYTGRRIHNPEAYRQLCDNWKTRHPGQDGGGYFLLWRKP